MKLAAAELHEPEGYIQALSLPVLQREPPLISTRQSAAGFSFLVRTYKPEKGRPGSADLFRTRSSFPQSLRRARGGGSRPEGVAAPTTGWSSTVAARQDRPTEPVAVKVERAKETPGIRQKSLASL